MLRSDVVRKELAGLNPPSTRPAAFGEGLYTPDATSRTYEELLRRARVALELGESVVLDASWTDARRRADAARVAARDRERAGRAALRRRPERRRRPHRAAARHARRPVRCRSRRSRRRSASGAAPWPSATVVDTSGTVSEAVAQAVCMAAGARETPARDRPRRSGHDQVHFDEIDTATASAERSVAGRVGS